MQETWVRTLGLKDPLEEEMTTHYSILAWEIQRSLKGYSPWGCKESVMTWQLNNNNNFSLTTQQQTPLPVSWPLRTQSIKWPIMTPSSQMLYPCLYHTLHFIIQNFSYSYNTSIIVAISMNHLGQYSLPTN